MVLLNHFHCVSSRESHPVITICSVICYSLDIDYPTWFRVTCPDKQCDKNDKSDFHDHMNKLNSNKFVNIVLYIEFNKRYTYLIVIESVPKIMTFAYGILVHVFNDVFFLFKIEYFRIYLVKVKINTISFSLRLDTQLQ